MGWLFMTLAGMGEHKTPKTYLDNQLHYPANETRPGLTRHDSAMVKGVYYAAISSSDDPARLSAVICLTKWNPRAADHMVFGYKDMSETMGPYNYDCPARILDLLTPTDNEYALAWRTACRKQTALTSRPKPQPGDRLRLAEPLTFSDGVAEQLFAVDTSNGKTILRRATDNVRVTLPKLMERPWQVIKPALSVPT